MAKRTPVAKNDPAKQRYELAPIDSIRPHPKNPNKGDADAIDESMDDNGFYGACLVQQSTGRILIGNHRWAGAKRRGETTIPVIWADVDDERALKIMMSDNATRQGAGTDQDLLAHLLRDLPDARGTGYRPAQVDALLKAARPTLSYLDAMRAGGDASSEEDDGPFDAEDETTAGDAKPSRDASRHALPIVLTNAEFRAWQAAKERLGEKKDKAAFMAMLEQLDGRRKRTGEESGAAKGQGAAAH